MGLRRFDLRIVLLIFCAVVNATRTRDCSAPDIPHGFFISERGTFTHDTELYYGCDENFMPVEGSWWGTVTCQYGNWSSVPQCIEDTACFAPEIPNANYAAFQYVSNNEAIWIKCNPGYEDKRIRARATCQNGRWIGLPECEKMENKWCGPPPQVPNAVIINQVPKDMFAEDVYVEYMCKSGFELETNSNKTICSYGEWLSPPSCRQKPTSQDPVPQATAASPVDSGSDTGQPIFTSIDRCGTPLVVKNAVPLVGDRFVKYKCASYYKLKGNAIVRCANGHWTPAPTCEVNFCKLDTSQYRALENIGDVFIKSETRLKLSCFNSSYRKAFAVCTNNQLQLSECCYWITHNTNNCDYFPVNPSK